MTDLRPLHDQATALLADFRISVVFLTRIPASWLGEAAEGKPDLGRASRVFPLVGALVGLSGGLVLSLAIGIGVPTLAAAILAVMTTMILTGGLHEDGLADTFDGLGGATREHRLEIMRDSRIGVYGASALVFSILLRVAALATLTGYGAWPAALALVAAEAASRTSIVGIWYVFLLARPDGLAHDTGPPDPAALLMAQIIAVVITFATVWPALSVAAAIAGILFSLAATYIFILTARAWIGGRTGDILGAGQQIAAAAFLLAVASAT